jgi:hypothetical protein
VKPDHKSFFSKRKWWLLIGGGVLLYAVVFTLIENLVESESPTAADGSTPATGAGSSPALPEVGRRDDGAVEIRHDFFRRTTIRLETEEEEQALFECLEREIEQAFGDGTQGLSGRQIRDETRLLQDRCMGLRGVPPVPDPPGSQGQSRGGQGPLTGTDSE